MVIFKIFPYIIKFVFPSHTIVFYLVCRHISAEFSPVTLRDLVKGRYETPDLSDRLQIARQILCGIGHLHLNDIFHRALKPSNIVISHRNGGAPTLVKLTNFGFTHVPKTGNPIPLWERLISSGTSKSWLAPESYSEDNFTSDMDMYTIGLLLGFIFSGGTHVYEGINKKDRIKKIKNKQPMTLTIEHLKSVPDATEAFNLMMALLNVQPCLRPTASMVLKHPIFPKESATGVNQRSTIDQNATPDSGIKWGLFIRLVIIKINFPVIGEPSLKRVKVEVQDDLITSQ